MVGDAGFHTRSQKACTEKYGAKDKIMLRIRLKSC